MILNAYNSRQNAREYINSLIYKELKPARIQGTFICPFCNNGTGADGDGITSPDGGKHWKCFKCGFYGDYLDYLKELHQCGENIIFSNYNISFNNVSNIKIINKSPQNILSEKKSPQYILEKPAKEAPRRFRLYLHKGKRDLKNVKYNIKTDISCIEQFDKAMYYDHVCCSFVDNIRKNKNYISSGCIMMDVDNDDNDSSSWVTPEDVSLFFADVPFYTCTSRSHMKSKNGEAPRPRFHVYFPVCSIESLHTYSCVKKMLSVIFPGFDKSAADASRFFSGTNKHKCRYFPGNTDILYFLYCYKNLL